MFLYSVTLQQIVYFFQTCLQHYQRPASAQFLSKCQIYENAFGAICRKALLDFSLDIEYVLIVDRYKLMKIFLRVKITVVFIVNNLIQFSGEFCLIRPGCGWCGGSA